MPEEKKDDVVVTSAAEVIAASAPAPTLEELRDAKVVPVAQGILEDIAGEVAGTDVNKATDFTSVIIKILKRALAADLNVTTENPYLFQLALGAYGALSTVVQKSKIADIDDARFG